MKSIFIYFALLLISVTFINFLINIDVDRTCSLKFKSCARFPEENEIFIDNLVWQLFETKGGFVKLLNAHLDTRWNSTVVRVNANGPKINFAEDSIYCQFWIDSKTPPLVIKVTETISLWTKCELRFEKS